MNTRQRAEVFTRYVGLELKGKIVAMGFTATSVAEQIDRSPAAFNRWLNGKAELPLSVLCAACELIDIEPQTIVQTAYDRFAYELGERNGFTYDHSEDPPSMKPLMSIVDVSGDHDDEDFDVNHEDMSKKDVALVAKRGKRKIDQDYAE